MIYFVQTVHFYFFSCYNGCVRGGPSDSLVYFARNVYAGITYKERE